VLDRRFPNVLGTQIYILPVTISYRIIPIGDCFNDTNHML
jgi:hypothetical protein